MLVRFSNASWRRTPVNLRQQPDGERPCVSYADTHTLPGTNMWRAQRRHSRDGESVSGSRDATVQGPKPACASTHPSHSAPVLTARVRVREAVQHAVPLLQFLGDGRDRSQRARGEVILGGGSYREA